MHLGRIFGRSVGEAFWKHLGGILGHVWLHFGIKRHPKSGAKSMGRRGAKVRLTSGIGEPRVWLTKGTVNQEFG